MTTENYSNPSGLEGEHTERDAINEPRRKFLEQGLKRSLFFAAGASMLLMTKADACIIDQPNCHNNHTDIPIHSDTPFGCNAEHTNITQHTDYPDVLHCNYMDHANAAC